MNTATSTVFPRCASSTAPAIVCVVYSGSDVIVLLCGGDKSTQSDDIERAKLIAAKLGQMDVE